MEYSEVIRCAQIIEQVAEEVVEEPDAVERHPEVIDALNAIASYDRLNDLFGGNGHDPAAFTRALACGLEPYRTELMDGAPELVEGLAVLAEALVPVTEPVATA